MKALDPTTGGYREVSFPSGPGVKLWSKVCQDCGAMAGGCFSGPGMPEPSISPHAICPGCRGNNLKLVDEDWEGHP